MSKLCFLLVLSIVLLKTNAFSVYRTNSLRHGLNYRSQSVILFRGINPLNDEDESGGNDSEEESSFDVDLARRRLQALVSTDSNDTTASSQQSAFDLDGFLRSSKDDFELPRPPPLTTMERDRRMTEIELLKQLVSDKQGDDISTAGTIDDENAAMGVLWNLWYSQYGAKAMKELQQTDQYMGDPSKWNECEAILKQLVQDYGIYFCEPLNRLATLYFLQGRLDESYRLCKLILEKLKPWHVGALSGMVQVCIGLGKNDEARKWAAQRLPSLGMPNHKIQDLEIPRRTEWVDTMVAKAQALLQAAEQSTQEQLGRPDEHSTAAVANIASSKEGCKNQSSNDDADDAWQ